MAVLERGSSGALALGPPPPAGTHVATCVKILDQFDLDPAKIGWLQEAEKGVKSVNVTRFAFGVKGPDGKTYYAATKLMRISGNEKAALYRFLSAWLGKPPAYGRDYAAAQAQDPEVGCLGRPALISVTHTAKGDKVYADVSVAMPVPAGMTVPPVDLLPEQSAQPVQQQAVTPAPTAPPSQVAAPAQAAAPAPAPGWGATPAATPTAAAAGGWGVPAKPATAADMPF